MCCEEAGVRHIYSNQSARVWGDDLNQGGIKPPRGRTVLVFSIWTNALNLWSAFTAPGLHYPQAPWASGGEAEAPAHSRRAAKGNGPYVSMVKVYLVASSCLYLKSVWGFLSYKTVLLLALTSVTFTLYLCITKVTLRLNVGYLHWISWTFIALQHPHRLHHRNRGGDQLFVLLCLIQQEAKPFQSSFLPGLRQQSYRTCRWDFTYVTHGLEWTCLQSGREGGVGRLHPTP